MSGYSYLDQNSGEVVNVPDDPRDGEDERQWAAYSPCLCCNGSGRDAGDTMLRCPMCGGSGTREQ